MGEHKRRSIWWVLLLLALGGAAVWVARLLRDDDVWTAPTTEPWEPAPSPGPAPVEPNQAEPAPEPAPAAPAPVPTTPAAVRADTPDDLTRIDGVGPKISEALVAAGLTTFAAVAAASQDELRAALSAAKLRLAPSLPTWSEQARNL
jgi:predicted flap endonuclease-1-like 5' DNA nuclease